jgi:hypothetical protein
MNNHNILIITLIVVIVGIQVAVFIFALVKIRAYKRMFSHRGGYKVNKVSIPPDMLAVLTPEEVLISQEVYTKGLSETESEKIEDEEDELTIKLFEDDDGEEEEKS